MSGVGGYVRRCERVKGTIIRNPVECPWCGVRYEGVRQGITWHTMPWHVHHPQSIPILNIELFDDLTETS